MARTFGKWGEKPFIYVVCICMTSTTNLIFTSYVIEKSAIIEYQGKRLEKMTQNPVFPQNENVPQLTDFQTIN